MFAVEDIVIEETKRKPKVDFKSNGNLTVEGRSLSECPDEFYLPLINWCKKLSSKEVHFNFKVEVMNSVSVRYFYNIIMNLEENKLIQKVNVDWYYDMNDINLLELGQLIGETCNKARFKFSEKPDVGI